MEYPGTRFRRPWRLLLLTMTIAAFFVIVPLVIISTAGFTYNWHEGKLEATGAISIDAMPSSATVFLNEKKLPSKLPIRLNHVPPGSYTIRLVAEHFYDWQKAFTVKSSQTVYFKDIQLIKKNDPQNVANGAFETIALSPSGVYLAFTSSSATGTEVWLLNTETNKSTMVAKVARNMSVELSWHPKNDYLAIARGPRPYTKITITPASTPERTIDMSGLISGPVKKFEWMSASEPALRVSTDNRIVVVSAISKEARVIIQDTFLDWTFENNELWTLTKRSGDTALTVTKDTLGFAAVVQRLPLADINSYASSSWRLAIARQDGALLENEPEQRRLLVNKQGKFNLPSGSAHVSPFHEWWFMWSPFELWGYAGEREPFLLNRSGERLANVVTLDELNTLALLWENRVSALFPVYGTTHTIVDHGVRTLAADPQKRTMYFSDKNGLWKLEY